jgi:hypothetical protein
MIAPERVPAALYALHRILIQARYLVGEKAEAKKLYALLDHAEILPVMIGNQLDESDAYAGMLESLGEQSPEFAGIARDYAAGVCGSGIHPNGAVGINGPAVAQQEIPTG